MRTPRTPCRTMCRFTFVAALAIVLGGYTAQAGAHRASIQSEDHGTQDLALYVDGSTGRDSNPCQKSERPCQTIQAAIDKIPSVITSNVIIHIAGGTYDGGLFLGDRLAPKRALITLVGEPRATLAGQKGQSTGILIRRAPEVVIQSLDVAGFERFGVSLENSSPVTLISMNVADNGLDGVVVNCTTVRMQGTQITHNKRHGVACLRAQVYLGPESSPPRGTHSLPRFELEGAPTGPGSSASSGAATGPSAQGPIIITNNSGCGVQTIGCEVVFTGNAEVTGNDVGLAASHGSEIDIADLDGVEVSGNTRAQLMADHYGVITNFMGLSCETFEYGVCHH